MVKPDAKHNYYADLELPSTASIDDIRKAYRKLALQYHPDRNAGREEECVPRFQAIQAANEVLSDATVKAKYDQDRRKTAVFPTVNRAGTPTTGNPYQATSAYPPPPRRTQPGTWQRPTPGYAPPPKGADRFTNFPKPSNTPPRNGPAADRAQQFRAWQNLNTHTTGNNYGGAANRRPFGQEASQTPQQPPPPPPPRSPNPKTPSTSRPTSQRQDTKMPTEEQIRAGMRYGTSSAADGPAAEKQSAWQAFNNSNAGKQGMPRERARRGPPATPKRPGGFDPSAPGSDERPAPPATGHYGHRHRSEDLGREGYPPPPPGPPPTSSPTSPDAPHAPPQRPYPTPLRPSKSRTVDDDVPYAEANRTSTPYSSFIGEKTQFSSEGLRRSASTRDTSQMKPEDAPRSSRTRSQSPGRRQRSSKTFPMENTPIPGMYSDSSERATDGSSDDSSDDPGLTRTPEEVDSTATTDRPNTVPIDTNQFRPPSNRPMKKPTPPSSRLNGLKASFNAEPPKPTNDSSPPHAQSESEQPNMQERASSTNMYAKSSFTPINTLPSFSRKKWIADSFGPLKTGGGQREATIPSWAVPSSVLPPTPPTELDQGVHTLHECAEVSSGDMHFLKKDPLWELASTDIRKAYCAFRLKIKHSNSNVEPDRLTLLHFLTLLIRFKTGDVIAHLDSLCIVRNVVLQFPSLADVEAIRKLANKSLTGDSFHFINNTDAIRSGSGRSRSVEDINTQFSQEGFSGTFQGNPDYFSATGRRPSPGRRKPSHRGVRSATTDATPVSTPGDMGPPPPPGGPQQPVKFSEKEWRETFKDASWTWTGTSPKPASKTPSRQNSRLRSQPSIESIPKAGSKEQPHVVDEQDDDVVHVHSHERQRDANEAVVDEGDAMDIDTPPHPGQAVNAAEGSATTAKEPRLYSVPRSAWREEQEKQHQPSSSIPPPNGSNDTNLKTKLDDLSHVEPLANNAEGLRSLADMNSTLPFSSEAARGHPTQSFEPQRLAIPAVPQVPAVPPKLTKTSWHNYALGFGSYLQHFHAFNKTMLAHFDARQKRAEAVLQKSSYWLEAAGDTSDELGFGNYLKGAREDEGVRETWNVGCERHLEAVNAFDKLREHVRKLAASGALVDV